MQRTRILPWVLSGLMCLVPFLAHSEEICDEFEDPSSSWVFRSPSCGPSFSYEEREGYLRITAPDFATAGGSFDNWTNADRAPTFERYDMGADDWTITTRLEWDEALGAPAGTHHVGLFFGFGRAEEANDLVYWGEYGDAFSLSVERTGVNGILPATPFDGAPVSLQIEKIDDDYFFRHRAEDDQVWIEDTTTNLVSAAGLPVSRVGLVVKTWGGASPQVTADFDYFCLDVPEADELENLEGDPLQVSPLSALSCSLDDGSLELGWSVCAGAALPIEVRINGELLRELDADETSVVLDAPFPGGSILNIEISAGESFPPLRCVIAEPIFESCDEFDDEIDASIWTFRAPAGGPTVSVDDEPDYLRFSTPAGNFDNWATVDAAPTFERYDMGERDWKISTRLEWDEALGVPAGNHHVGLMAGFGLASEANDVVYWGEYRIATSLRVERTGAAQTAEIPYLGAPVSLQIEKTGSNYAFSHRQDDNDPWTIDASSNLSTGLAPPARPVSRVGLIIKTWGGGPQVIADFDYFCLEIPESPPVAVIETDFAGGTAPVVVEFSGASSSDPSGGTLTYAWDFGDGDTGAGEEIAHTYAAGGVYEVTLVVTDDDRNVGETSISIVISDDVSPWTFTRVGTSGLPGGAFRGAGVDAYTLLAGGSTFASATDSAAMLHQSATGDFVITTRVDASDLSGGANARLGLTARASTDANASMVLMSIEPGTDGLVFRSRDGTGAFARNFVATADPPRSGLPVWLRLAREGATFIGLWSTDGVSYDEYARLDLAELALASLEVGLIGCSGSSSVASLHEVSELTLDSGGGDGVGPFLRGDCNNDGSTAGVTDAVFLLNYNFTGGPMPTCLASCDVDANGSIAGVTDAVRLLNFNFLGGVMPGAPFPSCGTSDSPGDVGLGCATIRGCAR